MAKRGKKLPGTKTTKESRRRKKGEEPYSNYLIMDPYTRDESAYENFVVTGERCGGGRRVIRKS